jgi:GNAT superfamily N-acetyltransferase
MNIRPATPSDAAGINRLLQQLGYPGTDASIAAELTAMLQNPANLLSVCEDSSSPYPIAGFLSASFMRMIGRRSNFLYINYFVVDEAVRSQGIGQKMEEEAVRFARDNDCSDIALHCDEKRARAHKFYTERQHYKESPKYLIKRL